MFDTLTLAELPPADEALRPAIRTFIEQHIAGIPMDRRARSWQGFSAEFSRALGEAGFLGLTLPKEYGGRGKGPLRASWWSRNCSAPEHRSPRTGSLIGRARHCS